VVWGVFIRQPGHATVQRLGMHAATKRAERRDD